MEARGSTNPLAYLTIGAAAATQSMLGLPQRLDLSAALATALFVAIWRKPAGQHLGATQR